MKIRSKKTGKQGKIVGVDDEYIWVNFIEENKLNKYLNEDYSIPIRIDQFDNLCEVLNGYTDFQE